MDALRLPLTSFDATYDALSAVLTAEQQRQTTFRTRFEALIAQQHALEAPLTGDGDADEAPRGRGMAAREVSSGLPERLPRVQLPVRTTHGGDFGPQVRAKLIREALDREGAW